MGECAVMTLFCVVGLFLSVLPVVSEVISEKSR
jgi:hypothetical protein